MSLTLWNKAVKVEFEIIFLTNSLLQGNLKTGSACVKFNSVRPRGFGLQRLQNNQLKSHTV